MAVKYDIDAFLKTYLGAAEKAVCTLAKDQMADSKYDRPCCSYDEIIKEGLFWKFCLENLDCFDDTEQDKVISRANRFAQNCGNCTVSEAELNAFKNTAKGKSLAQFVLDPDVKRFVEYLDITATSEIYAMNEMVIDIKNANLWDKFYAIYPFVGGGLATKKGNLRNIYAHELTFNKVTSSTKGIDFNGTDGHADTNLNFSDLGYTTIEDLHISHYFTEDDRTYRTVPWGAIQDASGTPDYIRMTFDGGTQNYFVDFFADNDLASRLIVTDATDPGNKGYYITTSADDSDLRVYRDNVLRGSQSATRDVSPVPDLDLYIGSHNTDGSEGQSNDREISFFTVGKNLTGPEASYIHGVVDTFLTALNKK